MDPAAWIRERGFNPESGLREAAWEDRDLQTERTAMHVAAGAGEL